MATTRKKPEVVEVTPEVVVAEVEAPAPKKRGAPKSELAPVALAFEKADRKYKRVKAKLDTFDSQRIKLENDLEEAVNDRDAAKATLEKALGA